MTTETTVAIPLDLQPQVVELEHALNDELTYWREFDHTIAQVLNDWAAFVRSSERYSGTVDEYLHELGMRDILADVLNHARPPLSVFLLRTVDRIDEDYRNRTELDLEGLMWAGSVDWPDHWWQRRVPSDGELLRTIRLIAPEMHPAPEAAGWGNDGPGADAPAAPSAEKSLP